MPRYDKYDPYDGGFRAPLNAAVALADKNVLSGASLNNQGRLLRNAVGQTGYVGVLVTHNSKAVGDIVDVMTHGEIVEFTGGVPGQSYYVQANGTIGTTPTAHYVGHTVEADRLVVRFQRVGA